MIGFGAFVLTMHTHDSLPKTLKYLGPRGSREESEKMQGIVQILEAGDQIMRTLRSQLAREGLTAEGFQALAALADLPEVAPLADLVAAVDTPRALLSETLTRLEYSGLIQRQRGEVDRRMVRIRMTPAGRQAIDRARGLVQRSIGEMVGDMGDEALRDFTARCITLIKAAQAVNEMSLEISS